MLKVTGYNNSVATPSSFESLILKQIDLSGIKTDFAWKSLILAQFSAEPLRGELIGFDTSHAMVELTAEVQFQFLTLKLNNRHNLKSWRCISSLAKTIQRDY